MQGCTLRFDLSVLGQTPAKLSPQSNDLRVPQRQLRRVQTLPSPQGHHLGLGPMPRGQGSAQGPLRFGSGRLELIHGVVQPLRFPLGVRRDPGSLEQALFQVPDLVSAGPAFLGDRIPLLGRAGQLQVEALDLFLERLLGVLRSLEGLLKLPLFPLHTLQLFPGAAQLQLPFTAQPGLLFGPGVGPLNQLLGPGLHLLGPPLGVAAEGL